MIDDCAWGIIIVDDCAWGIIIVDDCAWGIIIVDDCACGIIIVDDCACGIIIDCTCGMCTPGSMHTARLLKCLDAEGLKGGAASVSLTSSSFALTRRHRRFNM